MATAAVYTSLGDVIKYWYATNYSMEYLPLMISEKSWQKLSPEEQKVFQEAAKNFTIKSIDTAQSEDMKYMDLMKKKGIEVYTYTARRAPAPQGSLHHDLGEARRARHDPRTHEGIQRAPRQISRSLNDSETTKAAL